MTSALCIVLAAAACDRVDSEAAGEPADPVASTSLARCGIDGAAVLTGEGIGALKLGATVEQVTLACRVVADTTDARGPEGMAERSLLVAFGDGADTVRAVVAGDSIWRLHIRGAWPRAQDSLGVGSGIADLRVRQGAQLINGEGGLFVVAADPCGLSFRLDRPDVAPRASLATLGDSVKVSEVLVVGCR